MGAIRDSGRSIGDGGVIVGLWGSEGAIRRVGEQEGARPLSLHLPPPIFSLPG